MSFQNKYTSVVHGCKSIYSFAYYFISMDEDLCLIFLIVSLIFEFSSIQTSLIRFGAYVLVAFGYIYLGYLVYKRDTNLNY